MSYDGIPAQEEVDRQFRIVLVPVGLDQMARDECVFCGVLVRAKDHNVIPVLVDELLPRIYAREPRAVGWVCTFCLGRSRTEWTERLNGQRDRHVRALALATDILDEIAAERFGPVPTYDEWHTANIAQGEADERALQAEIAQFAARGAVPEMRQC